MTQVLTLWPEPTTVEKTAEAHRIMREAIDAYSPVKVFALVSGGHDSSTVLHVARPYLDGAVHIQTGIGVPETTEYVRGLCARWDVGLVELVTPKSVYRDIVLGASRKGFPGPAFHYITYHRLKSQRLQELQRDFSRRGERLLLVSGVRAAESQRRMRAIGKAEHEAPRGRLGRCAWANPIVHFTSADIHEYREQHSIPANPVVDHLHRSGECLCGAFAQPGELEEIEFFYPEVAAEIRGLEAEARELGKRWCKWGARQDERVTKLPGPLCGDCSLFPDQAVHESGADDGGSVG